MCVVLWPTIHHIFVNTHEMLANSEINYRKLAMEQNDLLECQTVLDASVTDCIRLLRLMMSDFWYW